VLVAVRGRPFWRGMAEKRADDALAWEILVAYRREGVRLLERLYGGFALAIVDVAAHSALLAIDRMGIERLAYAAGGGGLAFSTSAEAVATMPGASARLSAQALHSYLFFHMIPSPETVFEGVWKLPAGTALEYSAGKTRLFRNWQPQVVDSGRGDETALAKRLAASLRKAVRAATPGANSGAFLSGGLDSSTVAGVLSEVGPSPAKTFSIGFGYPDYDELLYARIANHHFGCQGHEYTVQGSDIAHTLPLIARAYDEPYGNSSALPAYYCARLAREAGVNHLLAGDGGDELFAGNSRYAEQQVFEWYHRAPRFLRTGLLEPALAALPRSFNPWPLRKARGYVEKANFRLPARLEMWNFVHRLGATEILHPEFLARIDATAPFAHMQEVWDSSPGDSTLRRMLRHDWRSTRTSWRCPARFRPGR
jgi:asparagine synthase (glutamine-hydrolysing)